MKSTSLGSLLLFVLVICGLALLSFPQEKTWVEMNLDNQKLQRAEELLWKQYTRDPKDLTTAAKLADTLIALGHTQRAKNVAQEVLLHYPENMAWKYRLAYILLAENEPFAAAEVLPSNERTKDFWLLLAEEYRKIAQDTLAEKALFCAYKDFQNQEEPWTTLALWRAERGDTKGEKEALEQALQYAPNNRVLLTRYFYNCAQAGDLQTTLWAADSLQKMAPLERAQLEALYALHLSHRNDEAARAILDQLVARADATVADSLALVSFLYIQQDMLKARDILEKLSSQAQAFSPDVQEAIHSQTLAVQTALALEAAQKGDEQTVLHALHKMQSLTTPRSPDTVRNMIYVCLHLSDFFKSFAAGKKVESAHTPLEHNNVNGHERARFWLSQAKEAFDQNADALPLSQLTNARLVADLAERIADWQTMLVAWDRVAIHNKLDIHAWLGIARASQQLKDYETSWHSLCEAEALAEGDRTARLALALQFQAMVAALPATYPQRMEKQRHADALSRQHLAMDWNDELALIMFFRALANHDLHEAEKLLYVLETRGRVTANEHLMFAETSLALGLSKTHTKNVAQSSTYALPPGDDRERVARHALMALPSDTPEIWLRLLYIFTAINNKKQVLVLLQRIEQSSLPKTAENLRHLSNAYGFLGDHARQLPLLEQRARLTGLLADWGEAIDHYYWIGNFEGALHLLDVIEKSYPNASELLARRLLVLVDMHRYEQAVKEFKNAQRQESAISEKLQAESLAALAVAYDKTRFTGRARHFFALSLEKEPANHRALLGMANLAQREGNIAEAVRYVQACIAHNPANIWAQLELANLRPHLGKQLYNQILTQTKPDAQEKVAQDHMAVRALALWRTGRLQESLKAYTFIMQEGKKNLNIMCDYAQLLMDMHKYEDARKVLAQTIQIFPNHVWAYRLDAAIFIRKKEYSRAESRLQQALSRAPHNPDVLRDLAFVQQSQKKSWAAQKHWLEAGKR